MDELLDVYVNFFLVFSIFIDLAQELTNAAQDTQSLRELLLC